MVTYFSKSEKTNSAQYDEELISKTIHFGEAYEMYALEGTLLKATTKLFRMAFVYFVYTGERERHQLAQPRLPCDLNVEAARTTFDIQV